MAKMLWKLSGFTTGTIIGTTFICGMDDVIYGQLRRNVVLPIKLAFQPQKALNLDELLQVGQGTMNFASQFKPHALGKTNVKALLMNDNDYATPQDHYFGYINKRDTQSESIKELEVLKNLQLDSLLPTYYNIETGKFDTITEKFTDQEGNPIKEEDMDIFDIARLRGVQLDELVELMSVDQIDDIRRQDRKQKHSKKDYERLKTMNIGKIVNLTEENNKKKSFQDDTLPEGMIKIEKKTQQAGTKKNRSQQQRAKDLEIKKLLQNPQDIDYDKAIKMYEEQGLEAKDLSQKDKRRLMRLKKKAEGEAAQVKLPNETIDNHETKESKEQSQLEHQNIDNRGQKEMATSIKIEIPASNSSSDDDVDDFVK